jgi:hypothetical protein
MRVRVARRAFASGGDAEVGLETIRLPRKPLIRRAVARHPWVKPGGRLFSPREKGGARRPKLNSIP